ncbi:hypothetical protein C8Q80DRAFT_508530 [Daedaleopsis nitida]|nr:hypothetical protein C8Q80DRAFT_508530 [Daedaleopsis nitida]
MTCVALFRERAFLHRRQLKSGSLSVRACYCTARPYSLIRFIAVGTPEWQAWKEKGKQAASKKVKTWVRGAPLDGAMSPSTAASSAAVSRTPSGQATPAVTSSSSSSDISLISPSEDTRTTQIFIAGNDIVRGLASLGLGDDEDYEDEYLTVADTASALEDLHGLTLLDEPRVEYTHGRPVLEVVDSLWGDSVSAVSDDEEEEDDDKALVKAAQKNPILCRIHNRVCKKGICKEYAEQLRKERNDKRRMEREEQQNKRNKKKEKNASKASPTSPSPVDAPHAPHPRAPPPHLSPSSSGNGLPAHLRKGALPLSPSSMSPLSPAPSLHGRTTPTPSRRQDDDAQSKSSGGWGSVSEDLWGPGRPRKAGAPSAPAPPLAPAPQTPAPEAPKAWGAWGDAPFVSASSVRRNNASWSVSTHDVADLREFDGDGDGDNDNDRREETYDTYDAGSVSGRSATGWGTVHAGAGASTSANADGPWGSTDAVRAAGAARRGGSGGGSARSPSQAGKTKKTWAEQMDDDFDTKSVAASTVSAASTWGNVSAGPW